MKSFKIISLFTGISLLASALLPGSVSAAAATMTLSGATQNNGAFSTVVYENSDGPVTSVSLAMSFSQPVSNVSYDYSVGPFTTTDPSGGHLAQGSVTGSQPVARVSFTLANPGMVNASVDTANSYLKGANGTSVVRYALSSETASFTYNAPAQGGQGGGSGNNSGSNTSSNGSTSTANTRLATTGSTGSATPATENSTPSEVKKDEQKVEGAADNKDGNSQAPGDIKNDDSTAAVNSEGKRTVWPWIVLLLIAATATIYVYRKRGSGAAPAKEEAAEPKVSRKPAPAAPEAAAPAPAKAGAAKKAPGKNRKPGRRPSNRRSR